MIERVDNIINNVEVKWTDDDAFFFMTKDNSAALLNKKRIFIKHTRTKKGIRFTLATVIGHRMNSRAEIIQSGITVDDLSCKC